MSLEIRGTLIEARRAEERRFNYGLKNHTFKPGDVLKFKVYHKKGLNNPPKFTVEVKVKEECAKVEFVLTKEKMSLFPPLNFATDYWYEIEYNGNKTPAGYDAEGPQILRVFPKGVDSDAGTM